MREAEIATDAPMLSERIAAEAGRIPSEAPADGAQEGATDPLTAFLAHASLEAGETQAAEGRAALQLMTVHAAKGLEFHTVFVTGLEEGLFPHENSLTEFAGVEEERRLMYVAITRAKRRLYLTLAQSRMLHGQTRYNIASRFLDELPRELVQWLSSRRRAIEFDAASGAARRQRRARGDRARRRARQRRRVPGGASARAFATRSSAPASSSMPRAAAPTRACRSTFARPGMKWLALEYAKLEPV